MNLQPHISSVHRLESRVALIRGAFHDRTPDNIRTEPTARMSGPKALSLATSVRLSSGAYDALCR